MTPDPTGTLGRYDETPHQVKDAFRFLSTPRYVGGYRLGGEFGLTVNLTAKPSAWHRFWMRVCLGWTWVDAPGAENGP